MMEIRMTIHIIDMIMIDTRLISQDQKTTVRITNSIRITSIYYSWKCKDHANLALGSRQDRIVKCNVIKFKLIGK